MQSNRLEFKEVELISCSFRGTSPKAMPLPQSLTQWYIITLRQPCVCWHSLTNSIQVPDFNSSMATMTVLGKVFAFGKAHL